MAKPLVGKLVLTALLVLLVTEAADARKRRHHDGTEGDFVVVTPDGRTFEPNRKRGERRRSPTIPLAAVVPPGWQLQPPEPNWQGKRFTSPDGAAWLAVYKAPADVAVAEHMKSVAFPSDGETLTYIQGERSWIAAAGFKGSHMFYRKALLSCGGRVWHHVAFEYPVDMKARVERFIVLAAEGLHDSQADCDDAVADRQR
jgi:hypothetical protein